MSRPAKNGKYAQRDYELELEDADDYMYGDDYDDYDGNGEDPDVQPAGGHFEEGEGDEYPEEDDELPAYNGEQEDEAVLAAAMTGDTERPAALLATSQAPHLSMKPSRCDPVRVTMCDSASVSYMQPVYADRLGSLSPDVLTTIAQFIGVKVAAMVFRAISPLCAEFALSMRATTGLPLHRLHPSSVVSVLGSMTTVPHINLARCSQIQNFGAIRAVLPAFSVTSVTVAGHKKLTTAMLGQLLSGLSNVRTLDISNTPLGDDAVGVIASEVPGLLNLNISGTRITQAGLTRVARSLRALVRLRAQNLTVSLEACAVLSAHPALQHLDLSGCGAQRTGALLAFGPASRIHTLVWDRCRVAGLSVCSPTLQTLRVNRPDKLSLEALNLSTPALRTLEVDGAPVVTLKLWPAMDDASGFAHISCGVDTTFISGPWSRYLSKPVELGMAKPAVAPMLPQLRRLSLARTQLSAIFLARLWWHVPELRTLNLEGAALEGDKVFGAVRLGVLSRMTELHMNPSTPMSTRVRNMLVDRIFAALEHDERDAADADAATGARSFAGALEDAIDALPSDDPLDDSAANDDEWDNASLYSLTISDAGSAHSITASVHVRPHKKDGMRPDDAISLRSFCSATDSVMSLTLSDAGSLAGSVAGSRAGSVTGSMVYVARPASVDGPDASFAPRTWMDCALWNTGATQFSAFDPLREWEPIDDSDPDTDEENSKEPEVSSSNEPSAFDVLSMSRMSEFEIV